LSDKDIGVHREAFKDLCGEIVFLGDDGSDFWIRILELLYRDWVFGVTHLVFSESPSLLDVSELVATKICGLVS
jgi:hypothetical protein